MGKNKKGGFLNPMDKIRKDSRRRELKKNKKQRLLAKTTLMKIRDPYEIISALDRLDRVEFDPYNEPVLVEKVLETKRNKLMSAWGKLMAFHKKEDKERYDELKKIEASYNDRRDSIMREYKAIRSTENVDLDEIPMPSMPAPASTMSTSFSNSFLNSSFKMPINQKPPGCPQGLPPRLDELDIDDIQSSDEEGFEEKKNENNLTEFLKEIEMISGKKEQKSKDEEEDDEKSDEPLISSLPPIQAAPPILVVNPTPDITPNLQPPLMPLPTGNPLSMNASQLRPLQSSTVRPSHLLRTNLYRHPFQRSQQVPLPPTLQQQNNNRDSQQQQQQKQKIIETKTTTIEAKPQLRNLSQDATRFMPASLRNKAKNPVQIKKTFTPTINPIPDVQKSISKPIENSKDAAYEEFMKEMSGFM